MLDPAGIRARLEAREQAMRLACKWLNGRPEHAQLYHLQTQLTEGDERLAFVPHWLVDDEYTRERLRTYQRQVADVMARLANS